MRRKKKITPRIALVIDQLPVIGHHYVRLHAKLGVTVTVYLHLLGANMRDHLVILRDLDAPVRDVGLALNLQLLDRYPELVQPDPTPDEMVQALKRIASDDPDLKLPMRITPSLVGLIVGRHVRSTSQWNTKKSGPSGKVVALMKTLMILLEDHPEPADFVAEYLGVVRREAAARGERDLFAARRWPPAPKRKPAALPVPSDARPLKPSKSA